MGRVLYSQSGVGVQSFRSDTVSVKSKTKKATGTSVFGRVVFIVATIFVMFGFLWFWVLNHSRYGNSVGDVRRVSVVVQDVVKQTDVEQYENAEAEIERYHLTGQYNNKGYTHDIVLNESYIDEEQARSFVGQTRRVAVDTASWQNVVDRGISYFCGIPVCFGLLCYVVLGIIYIRRN